MNAVLLLLFSLLLASCSTEDSRRHSVDTAIRRATASSQSVSAFPTRGATRILDYPTRLYDLRWIFGIGPTVPYLKLGQPSQIGGPEIAEWSKTGSSNDTIVISGSGFRQNTQFHFLHKPLGSSRLTWSIGTILKIDAESAAVKIPATLSKNALYLVSTSNGSIVGPAFRINAPEIWWMTDQVQAGAKAVLYGRNLTMNRGTQTRVYLRKKEIYDELMMADYPKTSVAASVTAANPYKIEFIVPTGLTEGDYEAFVHTGDGGDYGWSMPQKFQITNPLVWNGRFINVVKDYGAVGNNAKDNFDAVSLAIAEAYRVPNSTIYFPNGTYLFSEGFAPPPNTKWLGQDKTKTILRLSALPSSKPKSRGFFANVTAAIINNVTLENFTLDANGALSNDPLSLIFLNFTDNLEIKNMVLMSKGYHTLRLIGSTHIRISNSDIIGAGNDLGHTRQTFIDRVNFHGTNDAPYLISTRGTRDISVQRSVCRDFDNKTLDGWAIGRFMISQGFQGASANVYFAENTTVDMGYRDGVFDTNSGEQFLHEGANVYAKQRGVDATNTTVTFNNPLVPGSLAGQYVQVIDGTGLGQLRRIKGLRIGSKNTFVLDREWNIIPNATSFVQIGMGLTNVAVYKNSFSAKASATEKFSGSNGVMCYGACQNWEVTDNRMHKTRVGISIWGFSQLNSHVEDVKEHIAIPAFFMLAQNNFMTNNEHGIHLVSSTESAAHTNVFGTVFRGNTVSNPVDGGVLILETHDVVGVKTKMNVFESNTFNEARVVFKGLDNAYWDSKYQKAEVEALIFLNNKATNTIHSNATFFQLFPLINPVFQGNVSTGYRYGIYPAP